jgi:hypothetical protein
MSRQHARNTRTRPALSLSALANEYGVLWPSCCEVPRYTYRSIPENIMYMHQNVPEDQSIRRSCRLKMYIHGNQHGSNRHNTWYNKRVHETYRNPSHAPIPLHPRPKANMDLLRSLIVPPSHRTPDQRYEHARATTASQQDQKGDTRPKKRERK